MQQKWDDLDRFIINHIEAIEPEENYNTKLLMKLKTERVKKNKDYIAAVSFIVTGIFAMILYTSDIQYKFIDWEMRTRSQIMSIENNNKIRSIIRLIKGE